MKNRLIKVFVTLCFTVVITFIFTNYSHAALTVTTSKSEVAPGEKFNITLSVIKDKEAGEVDLTASNATLSQSKIDLMSQSSVTVTCTAGNSGTINIKASGLVANYETEKENSQSVSKSVTIKAKEEPKKEEPKQEEPKENKVVEEPKKEEPKVEENKKEEVVNKSSDASLSSLSISPFGKIAKSSAGIYDITVENTYNTVTITAVPNDSKATIISGTGAVDLEEGTNNFKVGVKAEDGTIKNHQVRIIRKTSEPVETLTPPNVIEEKTENEEEKTNENEFGLTNLIITGVELSPKFSADVYAYKAEYEGDKENLEIIPTATSEDAKVEVIGNSKLVEGENLITIIVRSADEQITKTYQITLNKKSIQKEENVISNVVSENIDSKNESNKIKFELKNKISKIILIALAAIIFVILIGIVLIAHTKKVYDEEQNENDDDNDDQEKNESEIIEEKKIDQKEEKLGNDEFKVSINEDKAYEELSKLSSIYDTPNNLSEDNNLLENLENEELNNDDDIKNNNDENSSNKSKGKRFK